MQAQKFGHLADSWFDFRNNLSMCVDVELIIFRTLIGLALNFMFWSSVGCSHRMSYSYWRTMHIHDPWALNEMHQTVGQRNNFDYVSLCYFVAMSAFDSAQKTWQSLLIWLAHITIRASMCMKISHMLARCVKQKLPSILYSHNFRRKDNTVE